MCLILLSSSDPRLHPAVTLTRRQEQLRTQRRAARCAFGWHWRALWQRLAGKGSQVAQAGGTHTVDAHSPTDPLPAAPDTDPVAGGLCGQPAPGKQRRRVYRMIDVW